MIYNISAKHLEENGYARLVSNNEDGHIFLFRKFDEGVWVFHYTRYEDFLGVVRIPTEVFEAIYNAPSIKTGDGKTKQTLE